MTTLSRAATLIEQLAPEVSLEQDLAELGHLSEKGIDFDAIPKEKLPQIHRILDKLTRIEDKAKAKLAADNPHLQTMGGQWNTLSDRQQKLMQGLSKRAAELRDQATFNDRGLASRQDLGDYNKLIAKLARAMGTRRSELRKQNLTIEQVRDKLASLSEERVKLNFKTRSKAFTTKQLTTELSRHYYALKNADEGSAEFEKAENKLRRFIDRWTEVELRAIHDQASTEIDAYRAELQDARRSLKDAVSKEDVLEFLKDTMALFNF